MGGDLRDAAYRMLMRLLPAPIAGYVLPGLRRQYRQTGVTKVDDADHRLLLGPANSAAQGFAWARAAERNPHVAAANMTFRGADDVFAFPADHVVPAATVVGNHRWRQAQRRAIHQGFTHVIVESGTHLYDPARSVPELLAELTAHGIRVGLLWHGSDIRMPSRHVMHEPDSPFAGTYPDTAVLEESTRRNHRLVAAFDGPVFVSTPDLLLDVPDATWLPVVVDTAALAVSDRQMRAHRPVVLHAPSRARLKGTAEISEVVRRLDAEGVIDYREAHGVRSTDMPALYADADIVLDQFLLGIYGVGACEAMAAGCAVVSHVSDQVRGEVRTRTGRELPIIEARLADLDTVLRRAAADVDLRRRQADDGIRFVTAFHDGRRSAEVLAGFLQS